MTNKMKKEIRSTLEAIAMTTPLMYLCTFPVGWGLMRTMSGALGWCTGMIAMTYAAIAIIALVVVAIQKVCDIVKA